MILFLSRIYANNHISDLEYLVVETTFVVVQSNKYCLKNEQECIIRVFTPDNT